MKKMIQWLPLFLAVVMVSCGSDTVVRHETKAGEVKVVQLPDASKATLNENSVLEWVENGWKNNKVVNVKKGEVFLSGIHSKKFQITAANSLIDVVGTSVNVIWKNNELTVETYEGKVGVTPFGDEESKNLVPRGLAMKFMQGADGKVSSEGWGIYKKNGGKRIVAPVWTNK